MVSCYAKRIAIMKLNLLINNLHVVLLSYIFYLIIDTQIGDRNVRRNSRNLWKVIGRSHYRRGESGK